jgi:calcineurin-like phosphoesterase family protein
MIAGLYPIFKHWSEKGTVWIISDPHFADTEQQNLEPNRPTDEQLVKNINSKVGKCDTLIILGDCGDPSFVKLLKGYKILVAGNHDQGLEKYREVFNEVYGGPVFIGEKLLLSHEPIDLPYAMNLHGHDHSGWNKGKNKFNFCANVIGYEPINFNQWMKQGHLAHIESIHRATIDKATERKRKKKSK